MEPGVLDCSITNEETKMIFVPLLEIKDGDLKKVNTIIVRNAVLDPIEKALPRALKGTRNELQKYGVRTNEEVTF